MSKFYTPILVVLLLVAVFFVGRLSLQVKTMKNTATAGTEEKKELSIDVAGLKNIAKELGLEGKDFDSCLVEGKFEKKVKDDLAYGTSLGVSGTPTFFVNGIMLVGSQPAGEFEKIIDAELTGKTGKDIEAKRKKVQTEVGYIRGGQEAKVKMVEFSDFQCPYCKNAEAVIEDLFNKYGDKISLEYRHFPLSFHADAQKAAEASECAGEQGKFWEMHNKVFEAQ